MTTTPDLVLRGAGGAVLRFGGGAAVTLRRGDEELRTPLEAIELVHPEGRAVEVVLTAPDGIEPAAHRVDDVSEAAVTAFAEVVNAALPDVFEGDPVPDGSALVTTRTIGPPPESEQDRNWRLAKRAVLVFAVVAVVLSAVLAVAGEPDFIVFLWPLGFFGPLMGVISAGIMGPGAVRMWRLPRHGITVTAEFSHYTDRTRVYRYTDLHGTAHTYQGGNGGSHLEISYDPRDPRRAVAASSAWERCMVAFVTLLLGAVSLACWTGVAALLVDALT
ncbi:hypothetical protein ACFUIT_11505 [Streptomyces sp. NPDC057239]|uniref:hypothetical protein n=1 Tax=Streptomyces sp. NPDC057239 TaxID=3346061 RepID=UPI003630CB5A